MNSNCNGPLGEHNPDDDNVFSEVTCILCNPMTMQMYNLSGMGPGLNTFRDIEEEENVYVDSIDDASHNQHNKSTTAEQAAVPIVVRNASLV